MLKFDLPLQKRGLNRNTFDTLAKRDLSYRFLEEAAETLDAVHTAVCFPGSEPVEIGEIRGFFEDARVVGIEQKKDTAELIAAKTTEHEGNFILYYGPASTQIKKIEERIDLAHLDFCGKPGKESFEAVRSYAANVVKTEVETSILRITHSGWADRGRNNPTLTEELQKMLTRWGYEGGDNPIPLCYLAYLDIMLAAYGYGCRITQNYSYPGGNKNMYTFWFSIEKGNGFERDVYMERALQVEQWQSN